VSPIGPRPDPIGGITDGIHHILFGDQQLQVMMMMLMMMMMMMMEEQWKGASEEERG